MHNWKIGNDWNKYKKVYMSTHFTAYLIYLCGYSNKFSGDLNLRVAVYRMIKCSIKLGRSKCERYFVILFEEEKTKLRV